MNWIFRIFRISFFWKSSPFFLLFFFFFFLYFSVLTFQKLFLPSNLKIHFSWRSQETERRWRSTCVLSRRSDETEQHMERSNLQEWQSRVCFGSAGSDCGSKVKNDPGRIQTFCWMAAMTTLTFGSTLSSKMMINSALWEGEGRWSEVRGPRSPVKKLVNNPLAITISRWDAQSNRVCLFVCLFVLFVVCLFVCLNFNQSFKQKNF